MGRFRYGQPTARQRECHAIICTFLRREGRPPTLREIGALMGIRSTNGVNDHLNALARHGFIARPVHFNPGHAYEARGEPFPTQAIRLLRSDDGRPIILGVSDTVRDELLKFHDEVAGAVAKEVA
jgi:SOS-response transcriptional repressor LexA